MKIGDLDLASFGAGLLAGMWVLTIISSICEGRMRKISEVIAEMRSRGIYGVPLPGPIPPPRVLPPPTKQP